MYVFPFLSTLRVELIISLKIQIPTITHNNQVLTSPYWLHILQQYHRTPTKILHSRRTKTQKFYLFLTSSTQLTIQSTHNRNLNLQNHFTFFKHSGPEPDSIFPAMLKKMYSHCITAHAKGFNRIFKSGTYPDS